LPRTVRARQDLGQAVAMANPLRAHRASVLARANGLVSGALVGKDTVARITHQVLERGTAACGAMQEWALPAAAARVSAGGRGSTV